MIKIRRSGQRGYADHGWLKTYHTFSFADYQDPQQMGFRSLRVINEDFVAPGQGFGTHSHRDMEIITYVISGALEHKDSMGNGSVIQHGDVQYMSAGSGVSHSEFNHSKSEQVHLLQIWIQTNEKDASPRYSQIHVRDVDKVQDWKLIVSSDGALNSIAIRQDAKILARILKSSESAEYRFLKHRFGWIQVVKGKIQIDSDDLAGGDGARIENEPIIRLQALEDSELLLFDLS